MPRLPSDIYKLAEMFGASGELKPMRTMKPLKKIDVELLEDREWNLTLRCTSCGAKFDALEEDSLDVVGKHLKNVHRGERRLIWIREL